MFRHILVSTDGSALSESAVRQGVAIAKAFGARLSAITVTVPFHIFTNDPVMMTDTAPIYEEDMRKKANESLALVSTEAQKHGLTCQPIHREAEHPWWAIIDTAKAEGCDLIVMSSHGRSGLSAVILGSQTLKVLANSGVPVLVSRPLFENSK